MKNKFLYDVEKHDDEVLVYYNLRKIFIELSKPKNNKELKYYEMYSNVLINMVFLKCRYQGKTEKIIKKFMKKYKKVLNNFNLNIIFFNK